MANPIVENDTFSHIFSFTQADVEAFAQITGDKNPVHLDQAFAEKTPFGRRIVHGAFIGAIVSKVLGMDFPGQGTIYRQQQTKFVRPAITGLSYILELKVLSTKPKIHLAIIEIKIKEIDTDLLVAEGQATVLNSSRII